MQYIYPDNLKSKPMLFLWELKDVAIVAICAVFSIFVIVQTGIFIPLVLTVAYGFLAIKYEGVSILGFIKSAFTFFFVKQQNYLWRL